jgi:hypothetical protein
MKKICRKKSRKENTQVAASVGKLKGRASGTLRSAA